MMRFFDVCLRRSGQLRIEDLGYNPWVVHRPTSSHQRKESFSFRGHCRFVQVPVLQSRHEVGCGQNHSKYQWMVFEEEKMMSHFSAGSLVHRFWTTPIVGPERVMEHGLLQRSSCFEHPLGPFYFKFEATCAGRSCIMPWNLSTW